MGDQIEQLPEVVKLDGRKMYVFYSPVKHTDWSMALAVPKYSIDLIGIFVGLLMLLLIAVGLVVAFIVSRIVIRRAVKPLKQLSASAGEVAKGHFSTALPVIKHYDEVGVLRDSFDDMQKSLTKYVEELKTTTASKAAIENELEVAHNIQMGMLPKTFPPYPDRNDIDIYGSLNPAKEVGGDLFDFYIRDDMLFFCIGDVSGKVGGQRHLHVCHPLRGYPPSFRRHPLLLQCRARQTDTHRTGSAHTALRVQCASRRKRRMDIHRTDGTHHPADYDLPLYRRPHRGRGCQPCAVWLHTGESDSQDDSGTR